MHVVLPFQINHSLSTSIIRAQWGAMMTVSSNHAYIHVDDTSMHKFLCGLCDGCTTITINILRAWMYHLCGAYSN